VASTATELELEAVPQVEDAPTPPRQREPRAAAWLRPDRVFIVLALLVGLCFAFITQPESGGDERDHFARAYQIAEGHLFTVKNPNGKTGYGAWFPRGLARDLQTLADVAYKNPDRGAFLDHLERDRGNSPRTRNARLAAIHSLYRYAALRHPEESRAFPSRMDCRVSTCRER